ncbi:response regulator transcription factor [Uliginosibacterium gangwonense]|uniref:response regulator transcription factor n=1 Tax=Uliginosibacterium gangwonense TaxID=392736 RepID=UPI00039B7066|nr:response regulator transcription factor [Uliginosibacterium gangwonense]
MDKPGILLVDDDKDLVEMLEEYLTNEGYAVSTAHDGAVGAAEALRSNPALVVMDVMMPKLGGIDALKIIRASSRVPIIMLTAKGDDLDRILGLELGADDYVPKPCTPRELAARIRAILRRSAPLSDTMPEVLQVGDLSLWPQQRRAELAGVGLELTSTEFSLLELLVRNAGRPVSKDELSEHALGRSLARFDRSIDVHMSSIRKKIGTLADGRSRIQTVIRIGYQYLRE